MGGKGIERFWNQGNQIAAPTDPLVPVSNGPENPAGGVVTRDLNLPLVEGRGWLASSLLGSQAVIRPIEDIAPDPLGGTALSRLPDISAVAVYNATAWPFVFVYKKLDPAIWQGWDFFEGFSDPDIMLELSLRDPYSAFQDLTVAFYSAKSKLPSLTSRAQNYVSYNQHVLSPFGVSHLFQMAAPSDSQSFDGHPDSVLVGGSYQGLAPNTLPFVIGGLRVRRLTQRPPYRYGMGRTITVPNPAPVPPLGSQGAVCIVNGGAPDYEPLSAYCRQVWVQNTGAVALRVGALGQVNSTTGMLLAPATRYLFNLEVFRADSLGVAVDAAAGPGAGELSYQLLT